MTPPVMPIQPDIGAPPPSLAKLHYYADIMREFGNDTSDPDVRDLVNLARLRYKQFSASLAAERVAQNQREHAELNVGPVAAAAIGGMEGLGATGGAAAGATLGSSLGPLGTVGGGLLGMLLGSQAGPAVVRSQAGPGAVDATLEANPWLRLGGVAAGGIGPGVAKFATNKFAVASARAVEAKANAAVAERIATARVLREEAETAKKQLELADYQRRLGHPMRAEASAAKYREIVAKSKTAEWDVVMAQAKAEGRLSPLEQQRLQVIGRQLQQADLRIEMMSQQVETGLLKPAQANAMLEKTRTQIKILEQQLTKASAQGGIAQEEATTRLALMKGRLQLLHATLEKLGLTPVPVAGSLPGHTITAITPP